MLNRILFWLLIPLTAVQGLWLKNRASRLPGAQGDRRGSCGRGNNLRLLAIGDSIIDGVGAETMEESLPLQFACALAATAQCQVHWLVEGESGQDAAGLLRKLENIDLPAVDVVLISIGVNDVTGLSSTRQWRRNIQKLLSDLQQKWPGVQILFTGLPPMSQFPLPPQPLSFSLGLRAATLDSIAARLCAPLPDVFHVATTIDPRVHTFCADGYHPSAESCRFWAKELARIFHQGGP